MGDRSYWMNHWKKVVISAPNTFAHRAYKHIKKQHKTLLDLGCGDGRDSLYFAKKGLRVTALDFSASGMKTLKSHNKNISYMVSDIRTMKLKPNSFDVIYAHLSLHYFDNRTTRKIFGRIHKILRKKGLLFVKCKSTDDALFGKGKKIAEDIYHKEHTRHFFSREYMAELLKDFQVISIRKTSSLYHSYKSSYIEAIVTK